MSKLVCFFITGQSYTDWKPRPGGSISKASSQPFPDSEDRTVPEDKKREIMDREKVWVPDPDEGFVLGQIVDLTEEGAMVQPLSRSKKPIEASFDRLYPTGYFLLDIHFVGVNELEKA